MYVQLLNELVELLETAHHQSQVKKIHLTGQIFSALTFNMKYSLKVIINFIKAHWQCRFVLTHFLKNCSKLNDLNEFLILDQFCQENLFIIFPDKPEASEKFAQLVDSIFAVWSNGIL